MFLDLDEPISLYRARERGIWCINHAGPWMFQRRRGQLMFRADDEADHIVHGVALDTHVDGLPESIWFRWSWELIVTGILGLLYPVAWPAGRELYRYHTRMVEARRLATPPIVAMTWAATFLTALFTVFMLGMHDAMFGPGAGFGRMFVMPWLLAQFAGIFWWAGLYGRLEGWLAIPGATEFWPKEPDQLPGAANFDPIPARPMRPEAPGGDRRPPQARRAH
ncbi:hypothetical protein PP352_21480 [Mycobacteroides abscessus]|nr:hypothetical protein [Mycobacteroides abscessus]